MTHKYKLGRVLHSSPGKVSVGFVKIDFTIVVGDNIAMTATDIDMILNQLGWQDGFRIPVANEENKRLEEEVKINQM